MTIPTVRRLLGWVPPTDDVVRGLKFAGLKAAKYLADAPVEFRAVDLTDDCVVLDQGSLGSCVSQAGMQLIRSRLQRDSEIPSRLWGYQLPLAAQGTPGQDVGTSLAVFFDAMAEHGYPRERFWPYETSSLDQGPGPSAWRMAHDQRADKFLCYHQIVGDVPGQVRQALSEGYLVAFGTRVDEAFFDHYMGVIEPPRIEDTVGGHAMVICGYETTDEGKVIYRILNSWGQGWGFGGFCWMSEDYLTAIYSGDFWFVSEAPDYSDGGMQ